MGGCTSGNRQFWSNHQPTHRASSTLPNKLQGKRKTIHTQPIKAQWKVRPYKDTQVLPLTDFRNLHEEDIPENWQAEVFRGATVALLSAVIRKLPEDKIDHMVTSVGINNRSKDFQKTTDREANRICEACSG